MLNTEKWSGKYDAAAQRALGDEEVLAAVQVTRAGGMATLALSAVSGLGTLVSMARQKSMAAGLPQIFFLAVTPERVYALGSGRGVSPKATKVLAQWDRADVSATTKPVINGTRIDLAIADGTTVACQGPDGELTDRVVRAIGGAREAVAA